MPRLLFEKTGNAIWISHLDLMRLFQRAFKRAGLPLTHTQGFNPRPSVSIALPLSVGVASHCELLDFQLDGEAVPCDEIKSRLSMVLVDGIRILDVYDNGNKIKNLSLLDCQVSLEYDNGVSNETVNAIKALFRRDSVIVEKHSKKGLTQQDIIPMIRHLEVLTPDCRTLVLQTRICCQNPTLNPMQMIAAIEKELPLHRPDFASCCRMEIYDNEEHVFR